MTHSPDIQARLDAIIKKTKVDAKESDVNQEIEETTAANRQEFDEKLNTDADTGYAKGSTWVLNEIFSYPHLSGLEKLLYICLWRHCHQSRVCYAGWDTLRLEIGCSRKTIDRLLYGDERTGAPGLTGKTRLPDQVPSDTFPALVTIIRRANHASKYTLNYKPVTAKPTKMNGLAH